MKKNLRLCPQLFSTFMVDIKKPQAEVTVVKHYISMLASQQKSAEVIPLPLHVQKTTECQRSVSCVYFAKKTEEEWSGVAFVLVNSGERYLQSSYDIPAAATNFHKRV